LVRRGRTYFAAGRKGEEILYTHHHTQVFAEFRECIFLGRRRRWKPV